MKDIIGRMREAAQMQPLFEGLPPSPPQESPKEERRMEKLAREFVKWCCSFGHDFRNSPDVANLRFWANKTRLKLTDNEESEIVQGARPLFLKRLEQLVRKVESPGLTAN